MTELILSIQFLTRLPTPQVQDFSSEKLARSARFFPLVGLIIGSLLLASVWLLSHVDPWLAAWGGLALWIWITGGLHLDGLADMADALGAAHRSPERFLEVMKDPHLGSFGVLTLILQTSGKLVLLMLLATHQQWLALLLIPAWARLGPLYWQTLPPISDGMAREFSWQQQALARPVWLALLIPACLWVAPALLIAPLLIWLYRQWLQKRLGGVSGDCLGAGIELTETGLLLATLLVTILTSST